MKIMPLNQHLLVEAEGQKESTKSGIILAGAVKSDISFAVVREIAADMEENGSVKVGDRILIHPENGNQVTLEEKEFLLVRYKDVFGVVVSQEDKK